MGSKRSHSPEISVKSSDVTNVTNAKRKKVKGTISVKSSEVANVTNTLRKKVKGTAGNIIRTEAPLQNSGEKKNHKENVKKGMFEKHNKKFSSVVLKNRKRNSTDKNGKEVRSSHAAKFNGPKLQGKLTTGGEQGQTEKPNWKELRLQKKELRLNRRKKKFPKFDVINQAKQIWEVLRKQSSNAGVRKEQITKLNAVLKGNMKELVYTHDGTRVIQALLKFGNNEIRKSVAEELSSEFNNMVIGIYSSFSIKKLIKYGPKSVRSQIIDSFFGNIVKLSSHKISTGIIDDVYTTWATPSQKCQMRQEFYGKIFQHSKDKTVVVLKDALNISSDMAAGLLAATKSNLMKGLEKDVGSSLLVQEVAYEFLTLCSPDDRVEILTAVKTSINNDIESEKFTRESVHLIMAFIWYASNKDKKWIIKTIRDKIMTICTHKIAYLVILALFDSVDDTVLMKKIILQPIIENFKTLASDDNGRKILLYLVTRRNPSYFSEQTKILSIGDTSIGISRKKDAAKIECELFEAVSPTFLKHISEDIKFWLTDSCRVLLCMEIIKSGKDPERTEACEKLASAVCDLEMRILDDSFPCNAAVHILLKNLIRHDKTFEKGALFSNILVNKLTEDVIRQWISTNRGCFLCVMILENGSPDVVKLFKKKFNKTLLQVIDKGTGGCILQQKLEENM